MLSPISSVLSCIVALRLSMGKMFSKTTNCRQIKLLFLPRSITVSCRNNIFLSFMQFFKKIKRRNKCYFSHKLTKDLNTVWASYHILSSAKANITYMNKYHVLKGSTSFVTLTFKEVNPRITLFTYKSARLTNSNLFVKSKLQLNTILKWKKNANVI